MGANETNSDKKEYRPTISLWNNRFGGQDIYLRDATTVAKTREELLRLANSLEVGMYLRVEPNYFFKAAPQPTHKFGAYTPKNQGGGIPAATVSGAF